MTAERARHRVPAQPERGGEVRLATELIERFRETPASGGPHRHAAVVDADVSAAAASDDAPATRSGTGAAAAASRTPSVLPHQSVLAVVAASVMGATAAVTSAAGAPPTTGSHPAPSDTQSVRLAAATTRTVAAAPLPIASTAAMAGTVAATVPELAHRVDAARIAARALVSEQERAAATRKAQALAARSHAPGGDAAPGPTGNGVGAAALRAALTKIGMPYVWGAAGPSAFDCSGLVLWAFQQVGVSLPHSASAQSTMGTAVSPGQLQPGDLVFFYSPVSHVGIYLGDGKVLNAPEAGQPVTISNMAYMPLHNARRL